MAAAADKLREVKLCHSMEGDEAGSIAPDEIGVAMLPGS